MKSKRISKDQVSFARNWPIRNLLFYLHRTERFFVKRDESFRPVKKPGTQRFQVSSLAGLSWLLIVHEEQFIDTVSGKSGGGAIDFIMLLTRLDFKQAVVYLLDLHKECQCIEKDH